MFNAEFYPTPRHVLDVMGIDCLGRIVLEPSAGKGDIVDYLFDNGASRVLSCEKNKDLQKIVSSKSEFVKDDFLEVTPEEVSHIDMIVMNPPFSKGEDHILHAFEIAPEGCEIIALCNYETVNKDYQYRKLNSKIKDYGFSENLGSCFDTAERKTGVEIGLVKLYKPVVNDESKFEGFFMDEEEVFQENGVIQFSEIRKIVNSYVYASKVFDELKQTQNLINQTTSLFGLSSIDLHLSYNDKVSSKEDFLRRMQKRCWRFIFEKTKIEKYVTSGVMQDINKFVETQSNVPFSERNVFKMLDILFGTRENTMNRAIIEAIDHFTQHTFENRYNVEGWKTNEGHLLGKKVIINNMCERGWNNAGHVTLKYSSYSSQKLQDLIKVLCYLTGRDYNSVERFDMVKNDGKREFYTNEWYDYEFFEFKLFYKGTAHLKFKNLEDWKILNQAYAKAKGQTLPEKL